MKPRKIERRIDNVVFAKPEVWGAGRRPSSPPPAPEEQGPRPVSLIRVPVPRPAMRGQLLRTTTYDDAMFYLLIREVILVDPKTGKAQEPFWEIGQLPICLDEGINAEARRFAEEQGWCAIRDRDYAPHPFYGALSTRELRQEARDRGDMIARVMPGYDDPAVVDKMLLEAQFQPLTRTSAIAKES
ncbi:MAG: hypothetical protein V1745_01955 [Patescibacteria group bacterium]